jgi:hypothetical protein
VKPGRENPRDRGDAAIDPLVVGADHCPLPKKIGKVARTFPVSSPSDPDYRFENWKRLRAPGCPYFFRSFMRGSRVSIPARLS